MRPVSLAAAFGVAATGLAADPLEGRWATIPDDFGNRGIIEIAPCGDMLCGTLVTAVDAAGQPTGGAYIGRNIIFDTVPEGGGRYRGRLWSPDRDETYQGRLVLTGDSITLRGCVLFVCRDGGTWTRLTGN